MERANGNRAHVRSLGPRENPQRLFINSDTMATFEALRLAAGSKEKAYDADTLKPFLYRIGLRLPNADT
jgi:hypothetical protein